MDKALYRSKVIPDCILTCGYWPQLAVVSHSSAYLEFIGHGHRLSSLLAARAQPDHMDSKESPYTTKSQQDRMLPQIAPCSPCKLCRRERVWTTLGPVSQLTACRPSKRSPWRRVLLNPNQSHVPVHVQPTLITYISVAKIGHSSTTAPIPAFSTCDLEG